LFISLSTESGNFWIYPRIVTRPCYRLSGYLTPQLLLSTGSWPALEPTQPPIQWLCGPVTQGLKRTER